MQGHQTLRDLFEAGHVVGDNMQADVQRIDCILPGTLLLVHDNSRIGQPQIHHAAQRRGPLLAAMAVLNDFEESSAKLTPTASQHA